MFVIIGSVAVALHAFVVWMERHHLARWIVVSARWTEYGLYGVDFALFTLYVARSAFYHVREMFRTEVD